MRRFVFLTTFERPQVLAAVIPLLRRALVRADAKLVVVDGGSTDDETLHMIDNLQSWYADRPTARRNPRQQMQRVAELADEMRLERYVQVDSDVILGVDALQQAFEARITPEHPVTVYLARGARNLERDEDGYVHEPPRLHWFTDSLRTVRVDSLRGERGLTNLKWGFRAWLGKIGSAMRLRLPQVQCQHIGYGAASGYWHSANEYGSWWIKGPCRDIDTGEPVNVDGFNTTLWQLRLITMSEPNYDRRPLCVDVDPSMAHEIRALVPKLIGKRRILMRWTGAWEGAHTWALLGVPIHNKWVYVR